MHIYIGQSSDWTSEAANFNFPINTARGGCILEHVVAQGGIDLAATIVAMDRETSATPSEGGTATRDGALFIGFTGGKPSAGTITGTAGGSGGTWTERLDLSVSATSVLHTQTMEQAVAGAGTSQPTMSASVSYAKALVILQPPVAVDTTPPTITNRVPAPSATDVPVTDNVVVTFSEAMDPASIGALTLAPTAGGPDVSASVAASVGNTVWTLDPASPLNYATSYTATVSTAAEDAAGNNLAAPSSWSFTTALPPSSPGTDESNRHAPPEEVTIRVLPLEGQWQTIGTGAFPGITPEGVVLSANQQGPDRCTFSLRREPGAVYPDLTAYTPCDVEVGGRKVWSGRVRQTPGSEGGDRLIGVEGQGWQYHLSDDVYQRVYVHNRLAEWRDSASFPYASNLLASGPGQLSTDTDGSILLQFPANVAIPINSCVGVTLDLGDGNWARQGLVGFTASANSTNVYLLLRFSPYQDYSTTGYFDCFSQANSVSAGPQESVGTSTPTEGLRYAHLFIIAIAGFTPTANVWFKVSRAELYRDPSYYGSAAATNLFASTVVRDAIRAGTALLSSDWTEINATSWPLPGLAMAGQQTPRQVIEAVNAFHDWQWGVDVERRPFFRPRPTTPVIQVSNAADADFRDQGDTGEDVYSRVLLQATGPDGAALTVQRTQAQQAAAVATAITSPAAPNPGFEVDTSSWTATGGSQITRTTTAGEFQGGVAGGKLNASGGGTPTFGHGAVTTFSGNFAVGLSYYVVVWARASAADANHPLRVQIGGGTSGTAISDSFREVALTTSFQPIVVGFTPAATGTAQLQVVVVGLSPTYVARSVFIDSVSLLLSSTTMVERRGFRRTRVIGVDAPMATVQLERIGDLYLERHRTLKLVGSLTARGRGPIRRVLGGAPLHPAELMLYPGEIMRLAHKVDPDTGALGREGRIAAVTYTHDAVQAEVSLDNERGGLEAMLARYGLVVGA